MSTYKKRHIAIAVMASFLIASAVIPLQAHGEVKSINKIKDNLDGISEEEKAVLERLFTLSQEVEDTTREEERINGEINSLEEQIGPIENGIKEKQKDYKLQQNILQQVLVNYQRGGPASYLEILLGADSLSEFIKSFNVIKDISHNVKSLLKSLKEEKKALQDEKNQLERKKTQLEQSRVELEGNLQTKIRLKNEQKKYLVSLQADREFYQEQLSNVTKMWENCRTLFPSIAKEISNIISAGYFTLEDLNLNYGMITVSGDIGEETFNRILSENSSYESTLFRFEDGQVIIELPGEHLELFGDFAIVGKSSIQYEVKAGTFYGMQLEASSIEELFQNGPLLLDFATITGKLDMIDFKLNDLQSQEDALHFTIIPQL